jgi:hypothetical protein
VIVVVTSSPTTEIITAGGADAAADGVARPAEDDAGSGVGTDAAIADAGPPAPLSPLGRVNDVAIPIDTVLCKPTKVA